MRTIWPAAWNDEEIWMSWTDERIEQLRNMWEKGLTASQIADELGGVSRNAVIGKAHRLGLKSRPSPVKATDKVAKPVKAAAPLPPLSGRLYRPAECRLCQVADGRLPWAQRSRLRAGVGVVLHPLLSLLISEAPCSSVRRG